MPKSVPAKKKAAATRLVKKNKLVNKKTAPTRTKLVGNKKPVAQKKSHFVLILSLLLVFGLSIWVALAFLSPKSHHISKTKICQRERVLNNLAACSVALRGDTNHYGSGFVVAPGLALTNYHVATELKNFHLTQGNETISATVSAVNSNLDLALIKFSPTDAFAPCELDSNPQLAPLTPLYAAGWPYNSTGRASFTLGHLSRYDQIENNNYLQIDINVMPGNSGGPIASDCGVVGINSFEMQYEIVDAATYQGFDYALPTATFVEWLKNLGIKL